MGVADTDALFAVDWEHFHPLDHSICSRRCGRLYGHRRRHMQLWWEASVADTIRIYTACIFGWHKYTEHWEVINGHTCELAPSCFYCDAPLPGRHAKLP